MSQSVLEYSKQYLEDILSFFGINAAVEATQSEKVVELKVPSGDYGGFLIGHNGETLRAIQQMIVLAARNKVDHEARISLDVADYKKGQADRLAEQVQKWAAVVAETGTQMELQPMNSAQRRVVHKTVGDIAGVTSESSGEGRSRHVVIVKE